MQNNARTTLFKKAVLAGAFAAAGVVLSVVSIPMGPTKCFPFQHAINVLTGIILGPWWAVGAAFTTSLIRNLVGTGTLFAFPGSMFGALFVGFAARLLPEKYKLCAACMEPIGTGIVGAWVGAKILGPIIGKTGIGFLFFSGSFLISSVPGAVIGVLLVYCLQKRMSFIRTFGALI